MSGQLALDVSSEWRALYFPPADRPEVIALIPDGHILGVRALARRKWRVWLMTDNPRTQDRRVIWKYDHVIASRGADAALWALRKHPTIEAVPVDAEGYVRG